MSAIRQQHTVVTVGAGLTVDTDLVFSEPPEHLTIWINSGTREFTNASFQLQINEVNYGAALSVIGDQAADILYRSGGAVTENDLIPNVAQADRARGVDAFTMRVRSTNNGAAAIRFTIHSIYIGHIG